MKRLNTTSVSLAVTPTVVSTLFSHYLNRGPLRRRPTAHLSYDEGLHLVRSFLAFASHHTVEELQAFTAQWVPHPAWIKVDDATVPDEPLQRAAELLQAQLGPDGIRQVGGHLWWQWRRPGAPLQAEWIETRADASARKKTGDAGRRVILYVHGGAYFFGSVDEHRYQMQRHARKLKARVFAPRYRLAPQFPFPCGLQDCIAAYLYLLQTQDPSTIILAGDSAGAGMVVSMLCLLRDQGVPLPAGGILLSPWVDLTHSFPSVAGQAPMDYIPEAGFHHKPSRAWPPPSRDELAAMLDEARTRAGPQSGKASPPPPGQPPAPVVLKDGLPVSDDDGQAADPDALGGVDEPLVVEIDGKVVTIEHQIQMYTTNALLAHPLVSPVMQPTLGGLPPLLIMVGGGEFLRDEQIYLAHKCANPAKYAPPARAMTEQGRALLDKYKPTDVQLQVWDDLCHVAPTLSFTRPAKYMYRSIAQFGAWALARAQKTGIDIMDDGEISVISSSASDAGAPNGTEEPGEEQPPREPASTPAPGQVGKAGDALPPFERHMIRQRVTRHGDILPLADESALPGCCVDAEDVGAIKEGPVRKWLAVKQQWDSKYAAARAKVREKRIRDMAVGFHELGPDERAPPTALAGSRRVDSEPAGRSRRKSLGLVLWSLWGSKHDEATVQREQTAERQPALQAVTGDEGRGARASADIEAQEPAAASPTSARAGCRSASRHRTVVDEKQTGVDAADQDTPVAQLMHQRREQEASGGGLLSADYVPETGVAGKRPFIGGIALPFSLNRDAETASMVTLHSVLTPASTASRPLSRLGPHQGASDAPYAGVQPAAATDGVSEPIKGGAQAGA